MRSAQDILTILSNSFSPSVLAKNELSKTGTIELVPASLNKVCFFLRDTETLEYDNLILLTAVDEADGEKVTAEDGSITYNHGTISVYYQLESLKYKHKLNLKVVLERNNPIISTVSDVWASANWHEREAFDLVGVTFENHPDLRRILMPYDWEAGYPLRKDYKDPEFYQGMRVPY